MLYSKLKNVVFKKCILRLRKRPVKKHITMGGNYSRTVVNTVVNTTAAVTNEVTEKNKVSGGQSVEINIENIKGHVSISGNEIKLDSSIISHTDSKILQSTSGSQAISAGIISQLQSEMSGLNLAQLNISDSDNKIIINTAATVATLALSECYVSVKQDVLVNVQGAESVDFDNNKVDINSNLLMNCFRNNVSSAVNKLTTQADIDSSVKSKTAGLSAADIIAVLLVGLVFLGAPIILPMIGLSASNKQMIVSLVMLVAGGIMTWLGKSARDAKVAEHKTEMEKLHDDPEPGDFSRTVIIYPKLLEAYLTHINRQMPKNCEIRESPYDGSDGMDGFKILCTIKNGRDVNSAIYVPDRGDCFRRASKFFAKSALLAYISSEDNIPPVVFQVETAHDRKTGAISVTNHDYAVYRWINYCHLKDDSTERKVKYREHTGPPVFGVSWTKPVEPPKALDKRDSKIIYRIFPDEETHKFAKVEGFIWINEEWTLFEEDILQPDLPEGPCRDNFNFIANLFSGDPMTLVISKEVISTVQHKKIVDSGDMKLGAYDYIGGALMVFGAAGLVIGGKGDTQDDSRKRRLSEYGDDDPPPYSEKDTDSSSSDSDDDTKSLTKPRKSRFKRFRSSIARGLGSLKSTAARRLRSNSK